MRGIVGLPLKGAIGPGFHRRIPVVEVAEGVGTVSPMRKKSQKLSAKQFTNSAGSTHPSCSIRFRGSAASPIAGTRAVRFALAPGSSHEQENGHSREPKWQGSLEHFQLSWSPSHLPKGIHAGKDCFSSGNIYIFFLLSKFQVFVEIRKFQAKYLLSMACMSEN